MGAGRSFIIFSLFFDSMQFVILANVIAFPFAYMLLNFISFIFEDFFGYQYQITPNVQSIIGGFFIGVLVPVVSSIVPIWGILKDDLA